MNRGLDEYSFFLTMNTRDAPYTVLTYQFTFCITQELKN